MLTGGEDNMLKVWDYEADKTLPYFYQCFIGHTGTINSLMFNKRNNQQVFSCGPKDGLYIWSFYGDTKTPFHYASERPEKDANLSAMSASKN